MERDSRYRKPFVAVVALLLVLLFRSLPAEGARVTEVADAFDDNDPFDFNFQPRFFLNSLSGLLTREYIMEGALTEVKELNFSHKRLGFAFDVEFGIYKDLSLGVTIPAYVSESNSWNLADIDAKSSTLLTQKRIRLPGEDPLTEEQKNETVSLIPAESFNNARSGFGDLALKFRWQALNDERKPYWASFMLGFDYIIATGAISQPGLDATEVGGVGAGVNFLHFIMSFSKRFGTALDPYAEIDYYLPQIIAKSITDPGHDVGFKLGSEFIVYEKSEEGRFVIDVNYLTRYTSEAAKQFTPMSDARGNLNREEQFITLGGGFGLYGDIGKYVRLGLDTSYAHQFQHFITYTYYGKDLNGDGIVTPNSTEYSPIFDKYTDEPGRRLRIKNSFLFGLNFAITARF